MELASSCTLSMKSKKDHQCDRTKTIRPPWQKIHALLPRESGYFHRFKLAPRWTPRSFRQPTPSKRFEDLISYKGFARNPTVSILGSRHTRGRKWRDRLELIGTYRNNRIVSSNVVLTSMPHQGASVHRCSSLLLALPRRNHLASLARDFLYMVRECAQGLRWC